jgi:hypothetical protein
MVAEMCIGELCDGNDLFACFDCLSKAGSVSGGNHN